jgi:hypothetical protein
VNSCCGVCICGNERGVFLCVGLGWIGLDVSSKGGHGAALVL